MESLLDRLTECVLYYESEAWKETGKLNDLLRQVTSTLFHLESHRAKYHSEFVKIQYNFNGSAAGGKVLAEHKVPELYTLRRIMESGYKVCDAIRSNISTLNKER